MIRFLLLFFLLPAITHGQDYLERIDPRLVYQDTSQFHRLILLNFNSLLGTAEKVTRDTLYFRVRAATETSKIPAAEIRYLGNYRRDEGRVATAVSPGLSDLTYERTALPFVAKTQLKIINLLYVGVEHNFNDHVQIGAGAAGPLGVLLTGRLRTSLSPNLHLALSSQSLYLPLVNTFEGRRQFLSDITALVTLGDERRFLNLGYGYFINTEFAEERTWLNRAGVGGRVGPKWHLYAEAVVFLNQSNDELGLLPSFNASYGSRRHRWRFGAMTVFFDEENFIPPPIPYLGYQLYW